MLLPAQECLSTERANIIYGAPPLWCTGRMVQSVLQVDTGSQIMPRTQTQLLRHKHFIQKPKIRNRCPPGRPCPPAPSAKPGLVPPRQNPPSPRPSPTAGQSPPLPSPPTNCEIKLAERCQCCPCTVVAFHGRCNLQPLCTAPAVVAVGGAGTVGATCCESQKGKDHASTVVHHIFCCVDL